MAQSNQSNLNQDERSGQKPPTVLAFYLTGDGLLFTTNSQEEGLVGDHGLSKYKTLHSSLDNSQYLDRLKQLSSDEKVVLVFENAEKNIPEFAKALGVQTEEIRAQKVDLDDLLNGMMYKDGLDAVLSNAKVELDKYAQYAQNIVQYASHHSLVHTLDETVHERAERARVGVIQKLTNEVDMANNKSQLVDSVLQTDGSEKLFVAFDMIRRSNPMLVERHTHLININNERRFGGPDNQLIYKNSEAVALKLHLEEQIDKHAQAIQNIAINNPELSYFSIVGDIDDGEALLFSVVSDGFDDTVKKLPYLQNESKESLLKDLGNKDPKLLNLMIKAEKDGLPVNADLDLHHGIKHIIELRSIRQDLNKLKEYTDKFQAIQNKNGSVPTPVKYAGATTGRDTGSTGGPHNFNSQGIPTFIKSVLSPPDDKDLVSIDFSSMEVAVAASITGNKPLLDAYNEGKDIYTAFGMQAYLLKQTPNLKPLSLNQLFDQVQAMKDQIKSDADLQVKYDEIRNLGKSFVLPKLYGSGAKKLAETQGISQKEAEILLSSFDQTFPEVNMINQAFSGLLHQRSQGQNGFITLPLPQTKQHYQLPDENKAIITMNDFNHFNRLHGMFNVHFTKGELSYLQLMERNGQSNPIAGKSALTVQFNSSDTIAYTEEAVRDLYGAKLFQNTIQGAAAAIVREFTDTLYQASKQQGLDVSFVLNVHDEVNMIVNKEHTKSLVNLVEQVKDGLVTMDGKPRVLDDIKWRGDTIVARNLKGDEPQVLKQAQPAEQFIANSPSDSNMDWESLFQSYQQEYLQSETPFTQKPTSNNLNAVGSVQENHQIAAQDFNTLGR